MGEGADPKVWLPWRGSALHQWLKLGTGSSWYGRIKPVFKSYDTQTEHLRVLWVELQPCLGRIPKVPWVWLCHSKTQEAQTGSQCNPCWEILSFIPQEGFTAQDCAFQSAANKQLDWVRPARARLNNKWKQRHISKTCQPQFVCRTIMSKFLVLIL